MSRYLLTRILDQLARLRETQDLLTELSTYFAGRESAAIQTTGDAAFDISSPALPANMDPDDFIDLLLQQKSLRGDDQARSAALAPREEGGVVTKLKEGSITKRKDGLWMGRYRANGKTISLYAKTQEEIIKKVNEAVAERNKANSDVGISKRMTLNSWFDNWVDTYKKDHVKASTLYNMVSKYDKYVRPELGTKVVQKLTSIELQKFFNTIEFKVTRRRVYTFMHSCFEALVKNHIIRDNPMQHVEVKDPEPKEKFVPSSTQLATFLERLSADRKDLALFSEFISLSGLRVGEALALTVADIDITHNRISVSKAYDRYSKAINTPKTKSSNRIVPLLRRSKDIIQEYTCEFGVKTTLFHTIKPNSCATLFRAQTSRYGLPELSFHGLRHYFATKCLERGIERKLVQRWMGHATYDITVNLYSHILDDFAESEVLKIIDLT